MKAVNVNHNLRSDDPAWQLLAEFSLRDFLSVDEQRDLPTAEWLLQTGREWGVSLDCMEQITRTLAGFVKGRRAHLKEGGWDLPAQMRVFCQKKLVNDANSRSSQIKHNEEQAQMNPDLEMKINGGWGYFLIERTGGSSASPSGGPSYFIDLYLYQEGE